MNALSAPPTDEINSDHPCDRAAAQAAQRSGQNASELKETNT